MKLTKFKKNDSFQVSMNIAVAQVLQQKEYKLQNDTKLGSDSHLSRFAKAQESTGMDRPVGVMVSQGGAVPQRKRSSARCKREEGYPSSQCEEMLT